MGTGEVSLPPNRAGSPVNTGTITATNWWIFDREKINGRTREAHGCAPTKRTIGHAYPRLTGILQKGSRGQKKNECQIIGDPQQQAAGAAASRGRRVTLITSSSQIIAAGRLFSGGLISGGSAKLLSLVTPSSACSLAPSFLFTSLIQKSIPVKLPSSPSSQFLPTEQHSRSSLPLLDWAKNRLLPGHQGATTDASYFRMANFNSASWGLAGEREYVPMMTRESGRPSVCSTFLFEACAALTCLKY